MFLYIATYYFVIKAAFFFGLVRVQVKFDTMKDHWLFLGILYTLGVAFLSYVFLFSWEKFQWAPWQLNVARNFGVSPELAFIGETFIISTLYFRLLSRFEDGVIFWTLLLLGIVVVWF